MLNEHTELLAEIKAAEVSARALYARGCKMDEVAGWLRQAGAEVRTRIAAYSRGLPTLLPPPENTVSPPDETRSPKGEGRKPREGRKPKTESES
jgi:hypothetical protein